MTCTLRKIVLQDAECVYVSVRFFLTLSCLCLCTWQAKRPREFYWNAYQQAAGLLNLTL